jgi:ribonuclease VapC
MIIDTSAIVAILRLEPEADLFANAILSSPSTTISAATYFEAGIVIDSARDPIMSRHLDDMLKEMEIRIEPVTEEHARTAREAYRDFGKGSGHPARLNFGDCFAYALAVTSDEPLLFKGDDFIHTDVRPALTAS